MAEWATPGAFVANDSIAPIATLSADHFPAAVSDESIRANGQEQRMAEMATIRVVVGVDDALERMRALGRGRHCYLSGHLAAGDRVDRPQNKTKNFNGSNPSYTHSN